MCDTYLLVEAPYYNFDCNYQYSFGISYMCKHPDSILKSTLGVKPIVSPPYCSIGHIFKY